MRKKSLIRASIVLFLSIILISTFKTEVLAQITPKVAIVSLEHVPFVADDNNEFYISAKNYSGQVQYQLFYIQESVMKEWRLINNADMVDGWTNSVEAETPIIVDISNLKLKAGKYRFAIRIKRVGVKGLYENKYGNYDDAYPFNVDVVKNASIELSGNMGIGKTEFTQEETLTISGIDNTPLNVEYKLHLFDVKNNKWLTNLTDYDMNINYSLKSIPEGTYIVDIWAKNSESKNKYDGWKLKVITINNAIIKDTVISLNKTIDSLIVGASDKLIAIDVPSKDLIWKSLNPEIAMVDNTGKVTAISTGVATILVTTADKSKTATCKITVTSELTPKQIFGKYGDAVVYIEVSDKNHILTGSGSGFIVDSNGIVVTNYHVIKGSSYANVTLQDGTKYDVKSVLNYNEEQDIAVLQLTDATNLNVTKLGDSSTMEIGDNVVAIGSPKGYENTLSTGIISGINRKSSRGNDIQTTASITHGSSGGALFNTYGDIIGITYAGYDSAGDIGFVIPVNEIKPFLSNRNEKTLIDIKSERHLIGAPINLNAWSESSSEISIQWDAVENVDGYYLYYSYDLETWDYFVDESDNKKLLNWYSDSSAGLFGIEPSTTVYFRVSAVRNGIEGDQSETINTTTLKEYEFFPLLSQVPMPINASYNDTVLSSDGKYIGYFYTSIPKNFFSDYFLLLEVNGWKYYKSENDAKGNPTTTFIKGENIILVAQVASEVSIVGPVH